MIIHGAFVYKSRKNSACGKLKRMMGGGNNFNEDA